MNKTLVKVEEFVDKAIKKIDEAVENACDQTSAKFSQQVDEFSQRLNEAESSARKVDEIVNRAVKGAYDQAFAQCSEQAIEAQSSTKKIDEHIEKAFDEALTRFSEQLDELLASHRTQQNNRDTVIVDRVDTAGHAAIETPRGSEQEPMEIEGDETVSATNLEPDSGDEDLLEDTFDRTCEHPSPGSIYAIHMDNSHKSMLAANKDSDIILWGYLNDEIGRNENQYCHWECISGPDDSLYFHFKI